MFRPFSIPAICLGLAAFGTASGAAAHISVEQAGTHESRYGDAEIKDAPCGKAGGGRGTHVYTYAPGETITLKVKEYIPHPGYFRIAFDKDGDDDFIDPVSIEALDPNRGCPYAPGDNCGPGMQDFYNTPAVLMDNLNPHVTAAFGEEYSWEVELPDVECTNCTLQLIQVMEDTIHGNYDTVPGQGGLPDVYHQCIDMVLERAPGSEPPPADGGAGDGHDHDHDADEGGSDDDGGCAVSPGSATGAPGMSAVTAALVALLGLRRRRR
jgi:MYXO-CTERM domain-containing protein